MLRFVLLILLSLASIASAQQAPAPIERRQPTPAATPADLAWEKFLFSADDSIGSRVQIRTDHQTFHCVLEGVSADDLLCHDRVLFPLFRTGSYQFSRPHIAEVRQEDPGLSGLVGGLIGFGVGTGFAAANNPEYTAQYAVFAGVLLGGIVGYWSYHFPFLHHKLYRRP